MAKLNHVYGNFFSLVIPLIKRTRTVIDGEETDIDTAYTPSPSELVNVRLIRRKGRAFSYIPTVEGSQVTIEDEGRLPLGTYDVEVTITGGEHPMRFCDEATIEVHHATEAAGIVPGETLTATTYTLQGAVFFGMGGGGGEFTQVQADWDQDDETAVDFIKHKPEIPSLAGYATENYVVLYVNSSMIGYATRQWVQAQGYLTAHQDLTGYATQQWVQAQGYLTAHQDISNKENKVSINREQTGISTLSAVVDTYHVVPDTVSNLAVTLPTMTEAQKIQGVFIYLKTGSGTPDVTFNSSHDVVLPKDYTIEADTIYEFNCIFNGSAWVVAYAAFEEQT